MPKIYTAVLQTSGCYADEKNALVIKFLLDKCLFNIKIKANTL